MTDGCEVGMPPKIRCHVTPPSRALLVTNHLADLAGSEIVVAEIAEVLKARGWSVTVAAPWTGKPMTDLLEGLGVETTNELAEVFPLEYDVAYVQHGLLALTSLEDRGCDRNGLLVTAHLSPFNVMEQLGLALDELLADRVWCNSEETCSRMRELGLSASLLLDFRNAAPAAFGRVRQPGSRVLFVSNHPPAEVKEAADRIEAAGLIVDRVGRKFGHAERVTPALIAQADRVITIGKTVQYALLARRPAFVYDRFGGPGYLDAENFEKARHFNFSGRSHPTLHEGPRLASLILERFDAARRFALALPPAVCAKFVLERQLDTLLACQPMPMAKRRARIAEHKVMLARERVQREALLKFWRQSQPKPRVSVKSDGSSLVADTISLSKRQGTRQMTNATPDRRWRLLEAARSRYVMAVQEVGGRLDWLPFPPIDDDYIVTDNPSETCQRLAAGSLLIVHRSAQIDNLNRISTTSSTDVIVIGPNVSLTNTSITFKGRGGLIVLHEHVQLKKCGLIVSRNCVLAIGAETTWEGGGAQVMENGTAILVGKQCMFSSGVELMTSDHHPIFDRATGERINPAASVMVGDRSWLGRGAKVGKGVSIAPNTIIGQGAIVTKPTEEFCLYAGIPAKLLKRNVTWRRSLKATINHEEDDWG